MSFSERIFRFSTFVHLLWLRIHICVEAVTYRRSLSSISVLTPDSMNTCRAEQPLPEVKVHPTSGQHQTALLVRRSCASFCSIQRLKVVTIRMFCSFRTLTSLY